MTGLLQSKTDDDYGSNLHRRVANLQKIFLLIKKQSDNDETMLAWGHI
jgi:hypothetical protein